MMVAQQLYEGIAINGESTGLITYMRTDSVRIEPEAINNARDLIQKNYGDKFLFEKGGRTYKAKASAQDAHEAIRPNNLELNPESLSQQ